RPAGSGQSRDRVRRGRRAAESLPRPALSRAVVLELPTDLPADLAPLAWLIGVWEGTGVIEYTAGSHRFQGEFTHRVSFSHDGSSFLNYAATASFVDAQGSASTPLVAETGFWRLARPLTGADPGPALLPPVEV